jgi:hypothetical protein
MGRGRWLLLAATVAAFFLVPSGASGDHLPAVSGKVVTTYRGWLQVSSLTGRDKWPLTPTAHALQAAASRVSVHPGGHRQGRRVLQRPHSGGVVYTDGRSIYEVSPATNRIRLIRTLPCPRRRCPRLGSGVYLAGITPDGRYALIEYSVFVDSDPRPYVFDRDYRLDLATGAVTKTHLITADPEEIYLN